MTRPPEPPPLIDITALLTGDGDASIDAEIHRACLETGFFVVSGHGLDEEIRVVFAAAHSFFALPQADKERTPRRGRYGYVPHAATAIDRSRSSDDTEYLDLGLHDEVALPTVDGFAAAIRTYQDRAIGVAAALLRVIARSLGTEPDFFAERMADPQCRLRMLHYLAAQPGTQGELPVPNRAHTDYGAITLLATDGVPGLEVEPVGGIWTPVHAPAGTLVVNLGDMLARWSNDRYRSTPHRVVGPVGRDRISIPLFVNPDPETTVECIDSCVDPGRPRRYGPVTAGAFLAARIDGRVEPYVDPDERQVGTVSP